VNMNVNFQSTAWRDLSSAFLAVPVFSDDAARGPLFDSVDRCLSGRLTTVAEEEEFEGKPGQTLYLRCSGEKIRRVLLVGMGKAADLKPAACRALTALAVKEANTRRIDGVSCALPGEGDLSEWVRFATEGALLGGYRYVKFRTRDVKDNTCQGVSLIGTAAASGDYAQVIARSISLANGVNFARDLVNGPPNEVYPEYLATVAQDLAQKRGLEIKVLDYAALQEAGMNLICAVGCGSERKPVLIHWTYRPENATAKTPTIAVVGKGLTFDAGGYNIKPTGAIEDMKLDMAGSAAVFGLMHAITDLAPNVIVHGIVPSCENLVSANAYKPGDIIKSYSGTTVEITNTDAEGRLALADALHYATELKVDRIVDLATLTGACVVALGPDISGAFSDNEAFRTVVVDAAERAGEEMWALPMPEALAEQLKTPNADLKNCGNRWGGALTAALFLKEFVGDTTWVHLDIAGPSFREKGTHHIPKGGTGYGVLTLAELVTGEM
jgi:leucyl aminopeptidase